jgi:hypothetical protein
MDTLRLRLLRVAAHVVSSVRRSSSACRTAFHWRPSSLPSVVRWPPGS